MQHECVVLRPLPDVIMDLLLDLIIRVMPFFFVIACIDPCKG